MLDAYAAEMFGAPNEWREEGGAFTRNYETDEYKDAIDFVAKLWKAGVCHPDSFSNAAVNEWFGSGRTSFVFNGGLGYHARLQQFAPTNPDFRIGFILPPVADGGGLAQRHLGPGYYTLTGISNGVDRDRIPEILNVLNYLAAPFGTEEYQVLWYGIEGVHSTWDEEAGTPIPTPELNVERLESAAYLARGPFVLFNPGYQYATEAMHAYQSAAIENGIHSASLGLHSTTEDEKQPALWANLRSVRGEVIQGRKPMSAWDDAVAEWKSGGGDQMRQELETAFAEEA